MTTYFDFNARKDAIEQEAYSYYEQYTGTTLVRNNDGTFASQGHNDSLDAFRHAYTSGRVTQITIGIESVSEYFGNKNEIGLGHPNTPEEHRMDLWNNEIGRRLGTNSETKNELAEKLANEVLKPQHGQQSKLITDLNDIRIPKIYSQDPKLNSRNPYLTQSDVVSINKSINNILDKASFAEIYRIFPRLRRCD